MSTSSHGCAACARDLWHIDCRTAVVAEVGVAEIDTAELSRMIHDAEKRGRVEERKRIAALLDRETRVLFRPRSIRGAYAEAARIARGAA